MYTYRVRETLKEEGQCLGVINFQRYEYRTNDTQANSTRCLLEVNH